MALTRLDAIERIESPMPHAGLIVIGAGQGGAPLAGRLAKTGKRVVLFERDRIGGTCVNTGCTPSKTLLASAHAAGAARRAERLGVRCAVEVDFPAVMERVRQIREQWREGAEAGLRDAGVEVVRASARFVGERVVGAVVDGEERVWSADRVVIDTGGTARVPPVEGLGSAPILTNANVFDLERRPARLVVIGGGYVGLELGQAFHRLGSRVTIVHRGARALDREDEDVSRAITEAMIDDGLDFRFDTEVVRVDHEREGEVNRFTVALAGGEVIEADAVLVAAGRVPNTAGLDAPAGGVELDERGFVRTDEHLRTTCEGVWAIGECAGQPGFTHVSWEDYRRVAGSMTGDDASSREEGQGTRTRDDLPLVYAVFTDPQVGRVGLSEGAARDRGMSVRSVTVGAGSVARAVESGREDVLFKLTVGEDDRIVGAALVGPGAGEVVHAVLAYVRHGLTWRDLERAMHAHPTYAEALPGLARGLMG